MTIQTYSKIFYMLILSVAILFLNEVAWCAEKEKVVFINERPQADGDYSSSGYYDIFIANYDGTGLKKLVKDGINPVPSPDGKKIAFIPTRILEDNLGLSIINTDGTGRKDLVKKADGEESTFYCCLRWSPDSRKIAYIASEVNKKGETGKRIKLFEVANLPIITWSPDSREILLSILSFTAELPRYVVINIKTLEKVNLSIEKLGKEFIMMLILDPKRLLYYKDEALWVMNRDGNNNKKLIHVGKIHELLLPKFTFEILPGENVRISVDESADRGIVIGLYEYNLDSGLLKMKARTDDPDFYGYFSYNGTKILAQNLDGLVVKDLKSGKVYMLCGSWRVFRQEMTIGYEHVNWVMSSK